MPETELPDVIATYQRSHDQRNAQAALATFSADATVIDDGMTYAGAERILGWLTNAAREYTYTRTLTATEDLGGGTYLVSNHLSGNFPGGEADLRYRFQLADGLIRHLQIAP